MRKQALLIIDIQQGLFPVAEPESAALIARLDALAARFRASGSTVIYVQNCGPDGDVLHPSQPGFAIHRDFTVDAEDVVIRKACCDSFLETDLAATLEARGIEELVITGCATDYCVDTTVRSALAKGYPAIVPADGHITFDRPHISAQQAITHHNAIWATFQSPVGPARLSDCAALG